MTLPLDGIVDAGELVPFNFLLCPVACIVKMIAEYLEHALQFEKMAEGETDSALKEQLLKQAAAYRKLATERAERLGLPRPPQRST